MSYPNISIIDKILNKLEIPKKSLIEFIRDDIYLPNGPYAGDKYDFSIQPVFKLIFEEMERKKYRKFAIMAPAQTGKTFSFIIISLLYQLFIENEPSIIFAVPNRAIGNDIQKRLIKTMELSPFLKKYIPISGRGSEGGYSERMEFLNGSIMYFLTGNGNDKTRSSISARVVYLTEPDGYDNAAEGGQESDKITQILLRTNAYADNARFYFDCTPSDSKGRIYREFLDGTQSEIAIQCQMCKDHFIPDESSLIYPKDAESKSEIINNIFVKCPNCGYLHNNNERYKSVCNGKLIHKVPDSDNLSIHLNCVHNCLTSLNFIGEQLYDISKRPDTKNAQQLYNQGYWGLPYDDTSQKSNVELLKDFDFNNTINDDLPINRITSNYENIVLTIDVGKHLFYYAVSGFDNTSNKMHIINYGEMETNYQTIQDEYKAFDLCISQIITLTNIDYIDENNVSHKIDYGGIDTGYNTKIMYGLCKNFSLLPLKGYSQIGRYGIKYRQPDNTTTNIKHRGNEYYISNVDNKNTMLFNLNASYYKEKLQDLVCTNNFTVYSESSANHNRLYKHISSERKILDKNNIEKWVKVYDSNHLLDCLGYALCINEYIKETKDLT